MGARRERGTHLDRLLCDELELVGDEDIALGEGEVEVPASDGRNLERDEVVLGAVVLRAPTGVSVGDRRRRE